MSDSKSRGKSKPQKLNGRKVTFINEAYSPKKLPKGMDEPKLQGFVGHQRPNDSSLNPSDPPGSPLTSGSSGESDVTTPKAIPANQDQK